MTRHTLFTIGHSTHRPDVFTSLLQQHSITAVCDVRSTPYSRRNPQFNREKLKDALGERGIAYVFLGQELGARSSNPACYVDGKVQYRLLAREPAFQSGLQRVRVGMESFRVALMCAERDPLNCHRTILVCRELRSPRLEINHILADGSLESGTEAERRLLTVTRVKPDLLHSEDERIEQAYDLRAQKIAYTLPDSHR